MGTLTQAAAAQPINHTSVDPTFTDLTLTENTVADTVTAIEAASNSPQTVITTQEQYTQIEGGVSANNNLFHRFDAFTVEAGHTANFVTPGTTQAVIGQVSGGNQSYIDGTLQVSGSDADLYLINPAGILFGENAQLNLGGSFTATTADQLGFGDTWVDVATAQDYGQIEASQIEASQIEAGPSAYKFTTQTPGSIINHADLSVEGANAVRFIGGEIDNAGTISAPAGEITLAAVPGESLVRLESAGSLLNLELNIAAEAQQYSTITPLSLPALLTGEGDASNSAIALQTNNDGTTSLVGSVVLTGKLDVSSQADEQTGGEINVLGTSVEVYGAGLYADGTAGGGLIRIGGDYQGQGTVPTATEVSFDGVARANALTSGNGGEIILWSEGTTEFVGELSANGAANGNGGLIETSGKERLVVGESAQVTTGATGGELGTWLLDPADLTIVETGGSAGIVGSTNTVADSLLDAATLTNALNNTNVALTATRSITVDTPVDASGNNNPGNLRLEADLLNLNERIDLQGTSVLSGTANTVNLGANGRLQNAVDAIATDGTINLAATTYAGEETFISHNVTLKGQGVLDTIISGEGVRRGLSILDGTTTIDSITIRDGVAEVGGGIRVQNAANLVIVDSNLINNSTTLAGSRKGGGVSLEGTGRTLIQRTRLEENSAGFGGGLALLDDHTLTVEDSKFVNNSASVNGGAVDINSANNATVRRTEFTGNGSAGQGGAISLGTGGLTVEDTLFENNLTTAARGGAIASFFAPMAVSRSSFIGNQAIAAAAGKGGAIATENSLSIDTNSRFEGNISSTGGALWLGGLGPQTTTISATTFDKNIAQDNGGAIIVQGEHSLVIDSSTLSNNQTTLGEGGAIALEASLSSTLDINNSTLSGNQAQDKGGAISLVSSGLTSIQQSTIAYNQANDRGAGINVSGNNTLNLTGSIVANNIAPSRPDIRGSINSGGRNLVKDRGTGIGYIGSDLPNGTDPLLGPLADNGGDTFTHALLSGSPALDTANLVNNLGTIDQRGAIISDGQDTGSYERLPASDLIFTSGSGQTATIATAYTDPIEVKIVDTLGGGLDGSRIDFSVPTTGATGTLSQLFDIADSSGEGSVLIEANTVAGTFPLVATSEELSATTTLTNSADSAQNLFITSEIPAVITASPAEQTDTSSSPFDSFIEDSNSEQEGESRDSLFDEYAYNRLEQSLSEEYSKYWQRPLRPGADLENVQQILQQAEDEYKSRSAIVYAVFVPPSTQEESADTAYSSLLSRRLLNNEINNAQDELLLLLIPPEGNPIQQRVKVSRRQLQRQAQLFNIELSSFFDNGYQPLARQLYGWLLAPVEDEIQAAGVDDLMYVLDEGLSTVPLAAMMTGETYAVERYGLSVLPSVGLLQTDFGEAPADQTILAGGSDTFTELEALPAVPVELGIVESSATSSQVLLNEDFSIDNLQQAQAQSPKNIMHVATHAAFNRGAADRSYVQFWQEQLKLEDITNLGLEDLELLILSACTTALGSREAELGFAGLAAATGVEASIGSLWNVSDLGTMALMAEFYEQLREDPLRFAALQQAQLSLLNGNTRIENNRLLTQNGSVPIPTTLVEQDVDFRHPFFWSGFTLVGNPWW